jgi:hypothetical protein
MILATIVDIRKVHPTKKPQNPKDLWLALFVERYIKRIILLAIEQFSHQLGNRHKASFCL